jgi:hypothetical protein
MSSKDGLPVTQQACKHLGILLLRIAGEACSHQSAVIWQHAVATEHQPAGSAACFDKHAGIRCTLLQGTPAGSVLPSCCSVPTAAEEYLAGIAARLNGDQARAVRAVLRMRDYTLMLGMPGTGKTTTIVHAVQVWRSMSDTSATLLCQYSLHSA